MGAFYAYIEEDERKIGAEAILTAQEWLDLIS